MTRAGQLRERSSKKNANGKMQNPQKQGVSEGWTVEVPSNGNPRKTTLCEKWLWGTCEKTASACPFAHGVWALQPAASQGNKSAYCKNFFARGGSCRLGKKCPYAHASTDISSSSLPDGPECPAPQVKIKLDPFLNVSKQKKNISSSTEIQLSNALSPDNVIAGPFGGDVTSASLIARASPTTEIKLSDVLDQDNVATSPFRTEVTVASLNAHKSAMAEFKLTEALGRDSGTASSLGRDVTGASLNAHAVPEAGKDCMSNGVSFEAKVPKSSICKQWLWGTCDKAAKDCHFAHGIWELKSATSNIKKTSYCKPFFSKGGHCKDGDKCPYAHSNSELSNVSQSFSQSHLGRSGTDAVPSQPLVRPRNRRHSAPVSADFDLPEMEEDLPPLHQFDATASPDEPKTTICKKWLWGTCEMTAATCPFAHGVWALKSAASMQKTSYCRMFFAKAGHCRAGSSCRYAHSSAELHCGQPNDVNPRSSISTVPSAEPSAENKCRPRRHSGPAAYDFQDVSENSALEHVGDQLRTMSASEFEVVGLDWSMEVEMSEQRTDSPVRVVFTGQTPTANSVPDIARGAARRGSLKSNNSDDVSKALRSVRFDLSSSTSED